MKAGHEIFPQNDIEFICMCLSNPHHVKLNSPILQAKGATIKEHLPVLELVGSTMFNATGFVNR